METDRTAHPPVDVEQWLDFIIAAASHRSSNEAHREFGQLLLDRYYVNLRDEYADDPVARAYLDNMLCAVSSAIRGFSVVRDRFTTNWRAFEEAKEREKARAERLDAFSPLKADGYWKPAVGIAAGLGLVSVVLSGLQKWIGSLPWVLVAALAVGVVVALFGMELFVDWLRNRRLARVEERFPKELYDFWREETLKGYRKVLYQFLPLAIKIREEFYPHLTTLDQDKVFERYSVPHVNCGVEPDGEAQDNLDELDDRLATIVERHFAFKLKD
jgi:hypothetical protein